MLPQFFGAVLLVGTVAIAVLALFVVIWARSRGKPLLARRALIAAAIVAEVYGSFWVLGVVLARRKVIAPGEAISFCGLDCHLHVSVREVRTGPELGVTVRFASNAVRAPEWPGELRFRLRDSSGREYAPSNSVPGTALLAGASWEFELLFPAAVTPDGSVLIVTRGGPLDYLVPGAGNPLAQRQRRLALGIATAAQRPRDDLLDR
jgi:hypothetical protein